MKRETLIIVGVALAAIAIGVGVFLSGRGTVPDTSSAVANSQSSAVTVPFTKLVQGTQSTVTRRVNYSITSADQLDKLWEMVDAASPPPAVDFKTHAVVAVFAGQQSTTGYAIEVSKVLDSNSRLVSITLAKPGSDCITGQSLTAPYEIVTVPATALPLEHEDVWTTVSCP